MDNLLGSIAGAFSTSKPQRIALLGMFALVFWIANANAAYAAARTWSLRYDILGQGVKIAQIGNALMTCSGNNLRVSGTLTCAQTQNGSGSSWYNDDYSMVMVNTDSDPSTVNSSTATLTIPAGAEILRAQLYWGGSFNPSTIGDQANANKMKFQGASGGYQNITADVFDTIDVTVGSRVGRSYGATADITNLFNSNNWGSGTYTGADVKATTGCTSGQSCSGTQSAGNGSLGNYAGWALLLVYRDASDPKVRYVGIDDGFTCVVRGGSGCPTSLNVSFTGFNVPLGGITGQRWGLLAWDGDTGNGDGFQLNGNQESDATHPIDNYFNSRISQNGANVTTRNPSHLNNLGIDLVESNSGNFVGGTTSIPGTFTTGTTSELVLQHFFWLEVETTDVDYGDDPTSYDTVSHQIGGSTTTLYLGSVEPDPEAGMQNTGTDATTARGDNTHGTNDEEGVTFPNFYSNMTSYTVTVRVKNTTGHSATLYAWIDLDNDGVFEASEYMNATIANGADGTVSLTWNGFTPVSAGTNLYARFRLTTSNLSDNGGTHVDERSNGFAPNGEVEDYRITVTPAPTAATLTMFNARATKKNVSVTWETGTELVVTGFNIWRGTKQNGKYKLVNLEMIAAQNVGTVHGQRYTFQDKTSKAAKTYFYKLQVLGVQGTLEWSNPKKVTTP